MPEINEEQSKIYNNALITWHHSEKDKADSYVLEYRKINRDEEMVPWNEVEVSGTSKVVSNLESNSHYAFRVRAYKGSICSPCSRELTLHTPPAPGTGNTGIKDAQSSKRLDHVNHQCLYVGDQLLVLKDPRQVDYIPSWDTEIELNT